MPTNHSDSGSSENAQNPKPRRGKSAPIINVSVNTGVDQIRNDNTTVHQQDDSKQIIVNVTNPQSDNSPQIAANRIANRSVIINLGLFIFTAILVAISSWQGYLTRQSVKLADSVFKDTKSYNDKSYAQSRLDATANDKREDSRDTIAKKLFKLQDSALNAQISQLTESQKQFKSQNNPYLQIEVDSAYFKYGNRFYVHYILANLTNSPVKIVSMKSAIYYDRSIANTFIGDTILKKTGTINDYVIKESPEKRNFTGGAIPKELIDTMLTGKVSAIIMCNMNYINLINKLEKIYKFKMRITLIHKNHEPYVEYLYNENYDAK